MLRRSLLACVLCVTLVLPVHAQTPEFCLKPVKVIEATQERWAPGVVRDNAAQEGGTIYRISVRIRKKGDVTFQGLILNEGTLEIEAINDGQRNASGPFSKGEELLLVARSEKKATPTTPPDPSFIEKMKSRNAAALLLFTYRGKQFIRPVGTFETRAATLNK